VSWLLTGGAGYIGAHVVKSFEDMGISTVVLDSLVSGKIERLGKSTKVKIGDIRDESDLNSVFQENEIEGIVHLAALKSVSESILNPKLYHEVNFEGTRNLVKVAKKYNCKKLIFSSTAAIYDAQENDYVDEASKVKPISPYGLSKLSAESVVLDSIEKDELIGTCLRFFNVAGTISANFKDDKADNLIPRVLERIELGLPPEIYGGDYPTPDGTCVRDYVHVLDVVRALELIVATNRTVPEVLNIGTGIGYSVKYVVETMQRMLGSTLAPVMLPARIGDPAKLVANSGLFLDTLGFSCRYGIEEILSSEIATHKTEFID